jgi:hypothetical protein
MDAVHIFVSTGRFRSFVEMRSYVEELYDIDGASLPSAFIREIGLSDYEPACIECVHSFAPVSLEVLLASASYSNQWLQKLDIAGLADAGICVFAPNKVKHPEACSLKYVGAFDYKP